MTSAPISPIDTLTDETNIIQLQGLDYRPVFQDRDDI